MNSLGNKLLRSVSEISSCFVGPRPWHIEIRHRVKKTSTISLFGFETLKLKIRRLKLWKPTVVDSASLPFKFLPRFVRCALRRRRHSAKSVQLTTAGIEPGTFAPKPNS